jgi:hypothetical protein
MSRLKTYYPADEITINLFTTGSEWMTEQLREYIGEYHTYTTGEVYSEASYNPKSSVKLIPYISRETANNVNIVYKSLKPEIRTTYQTPEITIISPSINDYKSGFFRRYFLKKYNEKNIIEVNSKQFDLWKSSIIDKNLYNGVELLWFISGPIDDVYEKQIRIVGVYSKNQKQISLAAQKIPELVSHLNNIIEFYADTDYLVPKDINGLDS